MNAAALPRDVVWMNSLSRLLFALGAFAMAVAGLVWLASGSRHALRSIRLEGELSRNSLANLRANALPRLSGNYFTLDVQAARAAFEQVPWVRRANVRRIWPDRLLVRLEEHHPVAVWLDDDGRDRLVNHLGEVFEVSLADGEDAQLPEFSGPPGSAATVLAMARRIVPLLGPLDLELVRLDWSERGSWELELNNGAVVQMGRGKPDEVLARLDRFVHTVTQVSEREKGSWDSADLRHADGYALHLRHGGNIGAAANGAAPKH